MDAGAEEESSSWEAMPLPDALLRGVFAYGFEQPSPIQRRAIPAIVRKQDAFVQAQSGTGKTGTFAIGALQRVQLGTSATQVLVLSPTKELSEQTDAVIGQLGQYMTGLTHGVAVGKTPYANLTKTHVVCGCVGRVLDLLNRKLLSLAAVDLLVVDEADEMVRGAHDDLRTVVSSLPVQTQIVLVSATAPPALQAVMERFMRSPTILSVPADELSLEGIGQYVDVYDTPRAKFDALLDLFRALSLSQTIIYCNTIDRATDVHRTLETQGYAACLMHGELSPADRAASFRAFKNGSFRILVSTDLTSRGIDIQQVGVVVNFDFPTNEHTYLHRIGRSGRWGRKGIAVNLLLPQDRANFQFVENHYNICMERLPSNLQDLGAATL